ncbi:alpha/beta hydrolase [Prauserella sp. PE36]|uniref:alpha/beta fold hydrolase n=1 Tax=Prauserella sp. PE36 TaxID=1504709 RepID=UPI000DE239ED|nr:alpha/beta hydrolase [Prauserella sp. PE36]RBM10176.1 alpha/beta hydrolase [Prauserella sp. PE36]
MSATFVLLPGAGTDSWYWHLVAPPLRAEGFDVLTPDLPWTDDASGLAEYADVVVEAIGDRKDVVLVAQSMSGFVAPMVCERVPVSLLVLVAAMTPKPGESPGEWWAATGQERAQREQAERDGRTVDFDPLELFFHDVPADVTAEAFERGERNPSDTPFEKPWPLAAWPDVPTRFLLCRDDRLFPADFQRRVVRERLGIVPDEMDGGHLPALARPHELTRRLLDYVRSG